MFLSQHLQQHVVAMLTGMKLLTRVLSSGTAVKSASIWLGLKSGNSGVAHVQVSAAWLKSITADFGRLLCFKQPCKISVESFYGVSCGRVKVILWCFGVVVTFSTTFSSPERSGSSSVSPLAWFLDLLPWCLFPLHGPISGPGPETRSWPPVRAPPTPQQLALKAEEGECVCVCSVCGLWFCLTTVWN